MKKSIRTLLIASLAGLMLAAGLNIVSVKQIAGPDGVTYLKGFPFMSGSYLADLTSSNNFTFLSYGAVIGNILVAFFAVFGIWGNIYFFREIYKK